MGAISKIIDIYRDEGWTAVINRGFKKIIRLLFETNSAFWFERDLSHPLPEIIPKLPVEINISSNIETLDWLKWSGEPWMFNRQEIDVGLKENHYFSNIKYQGRIIGYAKLGLGRVYIRDYKKILNFPDRVAFIYDTYIVPEYRGLKIATFLVNEVMRFLKDKGFKKIGCHIPLWNIASINTYTKLGFKKKKCIRYFKILGLKIFTSNPETI